MDRSKRKWSKLYLLSKAETSEQEAHAENEEQVGKYRPKEGCLDNTNFILDNVSCLHGR